jgi:hypothetical protein
VNSSTEIKLNLSIIYSSTHSQTLLIKNFSLLVREMLKLSGFVPNCIWFSKLGGSWSVLNILQFWVYQSKMTADGHTPVCCHGSEEKTVGVGWISRNIVRSSPLILLGCGYRFVTGFALFPVHPIKCVGELDVVDDPWRAILTRGSWNLLHGACA